mgnify:CR=1 FL=1
MGPECWNLRNNRADFTPGREAEPRANGRAQVPLEMAYDKGLAARMADALAALGERAIRQKNVFGGRGFLVRKHTFAIAWDEGLLVKCPADEYEMALAQPGVTPFAPDGENLHRFAGLQQLVDLLARGAHDLCVEAAAEPPLARHHDE